MPIQNPTWLWTIGVNSRNTKTGKIPSAYPASTEQAWTSCEGCSLRSKVRPFRRIANRLQFYIDRYNPTCYFWSGLGRIGTLMLQRYAAAGKDFSLEHALSSCLVSVKAIRMSAGGDPASTPILEYRHYLRLARAAGLAWLDYTHFWESRGAWLRGSAMASCDSWPDAVRAVRAGWRATVHVPSLPPDALQGKVDGISYTLCPAQRTSRKPITCNDCRLCDASRPIVPIIVFLNH